MDAQLERGLPDVCALAAIRNEDPYGCRIINDMKPCSESSGSALRAILRRIENARMLRVYSIEYEPVCARLTVRPSNDRTISTDYALSEVFENVHDHQ